MCYSARIQADYRRYTRAFGAHLSLREFHELFWRRLHDTTRIRVPKALEDALLASDDPDTATLAPLIEEYRARQSVLLEQQLFAQRKRLADAERKLQTRVTKAASESRRIAGAKVEQTLGWLADLRRTTFDDKDARIFPGHHAPVMVWEDGAMVVKPMRYQCRPAGKPAFHDTRYPGTYNARRDNLQGFWKDLFGHTHGVTLFSAFFENVGRPEGNVVLEFDPRPAQDMLVACLWSRWTAPGEPELLSFAAITDDPPPEVAAAGHDRCIIPIRAENVERWLRPDPRRLADQYAILDDRERPYYEHRLAA